MTEVWPFYVSYSWETEKLKPIVEKLKNDSKHFKDLSLKLDTEQCKPGDSIQAFLKEVGEAPRLILVLSDTYFESVYTLMEFAVAIKHGGLNTRVRIVLTEGFRIDNYLCDLENLQKCLNKYHIALDVNDYQVQLKQMADSLVSISGASKNSDFSPVLQHIRESFDRYPNHKIQNIEEIANLRKSELEYLRLSIDDLFQYGKEMSLLADEIQSVATSEGLFGKLSSILCPEDVGKQLQHACEVILFDAFSNTLEKLKNKKQINELFLENCMRLIGWVVTSFVNDLWIKENGVSISDSSAPSKVVIGLENGQLVGLIVARSNQRHVQLVKKGSADFSSEAGYAAGSPASVNSTIEFLFKELAGKFARDRNFSEMSEGSWKEIYRRIKMRRRRENIFISFRNPERWGNIPAELARRLPCLPQIWLQNKSDSKLLLLSESNIVPIISELINLIEEYRKYAKQNQSEEV